MHLKSNINAIANKHHESYLAVHNSFGVNKLAVRQKTGQ